MVNSKDKLLMENISAFYTVNYINDILPITHGNSKLSLRVLDWFVTNYSRTHNIILQNQNKPYNIYLDYKSQLKAFSKKQFDPFCRRERIVFYYDKTNYITTTVGQLNFFKWTIENNILEYVNNNLKTIEENMNKSFSLRITGSKEINKNNMNITISFQ
jgi:hypothetical protein